MRKINYSNVTVSNDPTYLAKLLPQILWFEMLENLINAHIKAPV